MILDSLGTMKNIISKYDRKQRKMFGVTALWLIIMVGWNSLCHANLEIYGDYEPIYEENYSIVPKLVKRYTLVLFDTDGIRVEIKAYRDKPPNIVRLNDELFLIRPGTDIQPRPDVYFSPSLGEVIQTYDSIYVGNYIIAYRESHTDKDSLIIEEIFSDDGIYMEIIRDFSPADRKNEIILEVSLINENTIKLCYLQGENYEEVTEEITIR